MAQLNYDLYPGKAFDGLIADSGERNISSYSVDGYDLNYGRVVCFSDGNGTGVDVPLDAGKSVAGITVIAQKTNAVGEDQGIYKPDDAASVLTRGRVWVRLHDNSGASSAGGEVYAVTTTTANWDEAGKVSTVATDNLAVANARFLTAAQPGELAIVEINLP
jgi:hypothetical protein